MIRKIVAIICLLNILCSISCCYGEDLKNKSIADLIRLQNEIEAELASRGYNGAEIYTVGVYEVGLDIEPGAYNLIAIAKDDSWNCEMLLYASYDDMIIGTTTSDITIYKFPIMQLDDIELNVPVRLRLIDGEVLIFGMGTYVLKKIK